MTRKFLLEGEHEPPSLTRYLYLIILDEPTEGSAALAALRAYLYCLVDDTVDRPRMATVFLPLTKPPPTTDWSPERLASFMAGALGEPSILDTSRATSIYDRVVQNGRGPRRGIVILDSPVPLSEPPPENAANGADLVDLSHVPSSQMEAHFAALRRYVLGMDDNPVPFALWAKDQLVYLEMGLQFTPLRVFAPEPGSTPKGNRECTRSRQ